MELVSGNFGKDDSKEQIQEIRLSGGSVYRCRGVMFVATGLVEHIPGQNEEKRDFTESTQLVTVYGSHSLEELTVGFQRLNKVVGDLTLQRVMDSLSPSVN